MADIVMGFDGSSAADPVVLQRTSDGVVSLAQFPGVADRLARTFTEYLAAIVAVFMCGADAGQPAITDARDAWYTALDAATNEATW